MTQFHGSSPLSNSRNDEGRDKGLPSAQEEQGAFYCMGEVEKAVCEVAVALTYGIVVAVAIAAFLGCFS